jgi:DNA topoisomerase-1
MEEELDEIETGKMGYAEVLDEFWGPFSEELTKAETDMPVQSGVETGEPCPRCGRPLLELYSAKSGGKFVGCSGYKDKENQCKYIKPRDGEEARPEPKMTDIVCPTCGKFMLERVGKTGPFLGCSDYPKCKTTMNIGADGKAELSAKPTEHICEKCGKPMVIRQGRRGPFLACTGYPKCKNAKDVDASGNPVKPVNTGEFCEKCNSAMVIKKGPRGPFLSCSGYPKCRNAKPLSPELKEKLKDQLPAPAPKAPKVEIDFPCPLCGGKMLLRFGRGRPFLGCANYPKCKGTAPATDEILAKSKQAVAE